MADFEAAHVRDAFTEIRRSGVPLRRQSTKWDIVDDKTGDLFPPKVVLFLAKQFANDTSRSGGGGDIGTNNALRERGFRVVLKPSYEKSEEAEDIEDVRASGADATTKRRLINARLGQGGFREELLELWERKCVLTQLDVEPVLRASHIKAWRDADDRERLDPANGLLLAASVDALFDRHLISFAADGSLLIHPSITESALKKLGLAAGSRIELPVASAAYMRHHRTRFEEGGLR